MATRVTILMPFRNAAATIVEAAASVLFERGVELEMIAVDDASSDDGAARLLAIGDERVRIVPSRGRGIAAALATGARESQSEFIARMDADDVSLEGRLCAELELLESDAKLGVVGTRTEPFPSATLGMRAYLDWQNSLVTPEEHARDLFVESPLCHPSTMMRRTALEDAGGFRDVTWAEDYDLWLRMSARGWKIAKVPAVLFRWRQHASRATLRDPHYTAEQFLAARAHYLAPWLAARGRPICVWGAGPTGKRLARALEAHGIYARAFVDIDPRKIGHTRRGVRVMAPAELTRGEHTVVVAVGAPGARALIRAELLKWGLIEGDDFVCAA